MTPVQIEEAILDAHHQAAENLTRVVLVLSIQARLLKDIHRGGNRETLLREIGTQMLEVWGDGNDLDALTKRLAHGFGVTIDWEHPKPGVH